MTTLGKLSQKTAIKRISHFARAEKAETPSAESTNEIRKGISLRHTVRILI